MFAVWPGWWKPPQLCCDSGHPFLHQGFAKAEGPLGCLGMTGCSFSLAFYLPFPLPVNQRQQGRGPGGLLQQGGYKVLRSMTLPARRLPAAPLVSLAPDCSTLPLLRVVPVMLRLSSEASFIPSC